MLVSSFDIICDIEYMNTECDIFIIDRSKWIKLEINKCHGCLTFLLTFSCSRSRNELQFISQL